MFLTGKLGETYLQAMSVIAGETYLQGTPVNYVDDVIFSDVCDGSPCGDPDLGNACELH